MRTLALPPHRRSTQSVAKEETTFPLRSCQFEQHSGKKEDDRPGVAERLGMIVMEMMSAVGSSINVTLLCPALSHTSKNYKASNCE